MMYNGTMNVYDYLGNTNNHTWMSDIIIMKFYWSTQSKAIFANIHSFITHVKNPNCCGTEESN